ncbi:MAG TPA: YdeI/OmpD-associated family protein [Candidatus Polarisedimenticolaceae bacterium]|nr:YdeI/OmpD-associated family protein [Candidatus Polarisedimenticolaceae bacterium]
MKPTFFASPSKLRAWLDKNHATRDELWVGFHKKDSGKPSVTWPEAVDEALCVGWIDGIRKGIDATSYTIRFTPRKTTSVWSAINTKRMAVLVAEKRVKPEGLRAFEARRENRSGIYSYEQRGDRLAEPYAGKLKKNRKAWAYWESTPPSYRKAAGWWVVSAKKEETRASRLARLIELSAAGERIPQFTRRTARS